MENVIVNIDSRFRDKKKFPDAGKFTYTLTEKIKNCKYIRVSSMEFPNLYFSFSDKKMNVSFQLTCKNQTATIKIADGMYSSDLLLLAIQEQLDIFNKALINVKFAIKFNLRNGFVTLECNEAFTVDFSNSPSRYDSLGWQLGFRKNIYTAASKVTGNETSYYLTTESQLDVVGDHYIFLRMNDYGVVHHEFEEVYKYDSSGNIVSKQKIQGNKNVLAKLVLAGNKTEQIFDNGSSFITKSYTFRQPVDITKFDIELLDPKGNTLDLVFMNFSLTVEIGTVFDSSLRVDLDDTLVNQTYIAGALTIPGLTKVPKKQVPYNVTTQMHIPETKEVYDIFENKEDLESKFEKVVERKVKKKKKNFMFNY